MKDTINPYAPSKRSSSKNSGKLPSTSRQRLQLLCAMWFLIGMIVGAMLTGLVGWRLYQNMSDNGLSDSKPERSQIQSVDITPSLTPTLIPTPRPTPTLTPTTRPIQALEPVSPIAIPTQQTLISGWGNFDVYSLGESDKMEGVFRMSEIEQFSCTCKMKEQ